MVSHTVNRIQIIGVRLNIMANEITIPRIGTSGTSGVRNGRGRSGLRRRRIHTPAQTFDRASACCVPPGIRRAYGPNGTLGPGLGANPLGSVVAVVNIVAEKSPDR